MTSSRVHLSLLGAGAAALIAAGVAGCGTTARPFLNPSPTVSASFPNTTSDIHLGLAFAYPTSDGKELASHVNYVFGGYFVDWGAGVHPQHSAHVDAYLPFDTDAYSQSIPGHSLRDWQRIHPDWIVYKCDRVTPAYYGTGNTNVPLDFSNPAVRSYEEHEAARMLQEGASGVAFDDFTFTNYEDRCGVYRSRAWTPLGYPGRSQQNTKLDDDMLGWLQSMRQYLDRRFPAKTLAVNMDLLTSGPDRLHAVAPYVDMVFDESGFSAGGTGDLSGAQWQEEVGDLEYLNSQGKAFDVNGIVDASSDSAVTQQEISWVLANYLLVKGSHSYTYVYAGNGAGFTGSPSGYGAFDDRPGYHVAIGHPTSARFESHGLQMRDYSGGLVIVNPSDSEARTVPLAHPYWDIEGGRDASSVTLAPTTAVVLLVRESPVP